MAQLVLGGAQEALLAGGAHDVVVEMAEADVGERVVAAQRLVAGAQVDLRPVRGLRQAGVGVVVAAVDVDVHAAQVVDGLDEAAERGRHGVVDAERLALGAEQRLQRARGEVEPAEAVGVVDLRQPVAGDLDREVARDREHGGRVRLGVEPQEHQRVRPRVLAALAVALVGADEQDRLRLAGLGLGDRARRHRRLGAEVVEVVLDLLELEQAGGSHGAAAEHGDDQRAQQHAQEQPASAPVSFHADEGNCEGGRCRHGSPQIAGFTGANRRERAARRWG